jgi:hypothetical protein
MREFIVGDSVTARGGRIEKIDLPEGYFVFRLSGIDPDSVTDDDLSWIDEACFCYTDTAWDYAEASPAHFRSLIDRNMLTVTVPEKFAWYKGKPIVCSCECPSIQLVYGKPSAAVQAQYEDNSKRLREAFGKEFK